MSVCFHLRLVQRICVQVSKRACVRERIFYEVVYIGVCSYFYLSVCECISVCLYIRLML